MEQKHSSPLGPLTIPGSSPISARMGTPAATAFSCSACSSGETYEAVTRGVFTAMHSSATGACIGAGSSERAASAVPSSARTPAQPCALDGRASSVTGSRLGRPIEAQSRSASPGTAETTETVSWPDRESNSTAGPAHKPAPRTTSLRPTVACAVSPPAASPPPPRSRVAAREEAVEEAAAAVVGEEETAAAADEVKIGSVLMVRSKTPPQCSGSSTTVASAIGIRTASSRSLSMTASSAGRPWSRVS